MNTLFNTDLVEKIISETPQSTQTVAISAKTYGKPAIFDLFWARKGPKCGK